MTSGNAHIGHERGSEGKRSEKEEEEPAPSGHPGVGGAGGYTPAAGVVGSRPARAAEPIPPEADEAEYSPGVASPLRCRSIGTAHVLSTGGSRECWPHRPRAGFHRLLGDAHATRARSQRDPAGFHPVEEESRLR